MSTITIGVDVAKNVFSVCELDAGGRVRQRKDFRRDAFAAWLAQVPAGAVVAMEACSGAHHWARCCHEYGLQPRLMAAQFVSPFRKSRSAKNDRNDAEAIATAGRQGNMRFVPVKSVDQLFAFELSVANVSSWPKSIVNSIGIADLLPNSRADNAWFATYHYTQHAQAAPVRFMRDGRVSLETLRH